MKSFRETFPDLEMDDYFERLFSETEVKAICRTADHTGLNIHIVSHKLIDKKDIYKMENLLRTGLFGEGSPIRIRIVEQFDLTSRFSLESLLKTYRDSILEEIKRCSSIELQLLKRAEWTVEEDTITLTFPEDLPDGWKAWTSHSATFLEQVFAERFCVTARVKTVFPDNPREELLEDTVLTAAKQRPSLDFSWQNQEAGKGAFPGESEGNGMPFQTEQSEQEAQYYSNLVPPTEYYEQMNAAPQTPAPESKPSPKPDSSSAASNTGEASKKQKTGNTAEKRYSGRGTYGKKGASFGSDKEKYPDLVYGRYFEEDFTPIEDVTEDMGVIAIRGCVVKSEFKPLRKYPEKGILISIVTDYTDSIQVKLFCTVEESPEMEKEFAPGKFLAIKGSAAYNGYDNQVEISSPVGVKRISDFRVFRMDEAEEKRVELHLLTTMSEMDAVTSIEDYIKNAKKWGHTAMAVTDHGCAYAFPQAAHYLRDTKDDEFKMIYGIQGYLVDDSKRIVMNYHPKKAEDGTTLEEEKISLSDTCVIFDLETTGLTAGVHKIIEFGAVKMKNGVEVDHFSEFVDPQEPLSTKIRELTSIEDHMLAGKDTFEKVVPRFLEFCKDARFIVGHNVEFDIKFVKHFARELGMDFNPVYMDTVTMARTVLPKLNKLTLDTVGKELKIPSFHHHRAVDDAGATAAIFLKMADMIAERAGGKDFDTLLEKILITPDQIKKMHAYDVSILMTNLTGKVNLYHLISESNINYLNRVPKIPWSLIEKYREGLLIGSSGSDGELFQALLEGENEDVIAGIVERYDYLEIMPAANHAHFIDEESSYISSLEDIQELNRRIVELGEHFHKPVVAVGDVHFLNPSDSIYRKIIKESIKNGPKRADGGDSLYFRTTGEMLQEFAYLGADKSHEVVVTNTNLIADRIEKISPINPQKYPPVIENSDQILTDLCYQTAHEMYGPDLPEEVSGRLDHELHSIISNGFAVMYIIAQKLVKKSNDDGYLVGSRGSVGSSFVATMSGITEVNPLSPHYLCPECYYVDFKSPEVRKFAGGAGCDMPDKLCPKCGHPLKKQGFDIPFETFLGFKGDKEPDIDLNFSGEYQAKAHDYTEVIFGAGQTFRAGTLGTVADKTAYMYVKDYLENHGVVKRPCEIERLAIGCTGVRRSTGQHPGGIVVLPIGVDINTITPIQYPASDDTKMITTHFEYHSIDHNLLKLDILGHDDPTMIKMLEDLTGEVLTKVPLDDPKVMSLFMNLDSLGLKPEQLGGVDRGALAMPEFGTDFAMGMLRDAKPTKFSDLVRIAGLAHGTDVWLGNAKDLILSGQCDISTAICTRDDIMVYLINMGLESEMSFKIMEAVRKGTVAKGKCGNWDAWCEEMRAHDVPEWYIGSCKKIKYMFPKAHAAAYVMMAWRIGYCKVYHPMAFYAAYFSIRADGFSYEYCATGAENIKRNLQELRDRAKSDNPEDKLSNTQEGLLAALRVVEEMYARGFEFAPIDLYKAHATRFTIVDDKRIMPCFTSIDGLGEGVAQRLQAAAAKGEFLSKQDIASRTSLSRTLIDKMESLGIISGLPEDNQLSIFDFIGGGSMK